MSDAQVGNLQLSPIMQMALPDLIDELRGELQISQRELAGRLGLSEDQLYRRKKQEVRMPRSLTTQLRMMLLQARRQGGLSAKVDIDTAQTGRVPLRPQDPVVAAAGRGLPAPEPHIERFEIEMSPVEGAMQELEAAITGGRFDSLRRGAPKPAGNPLEQLFDGISAGYPLALAVTAGRGFETLCADLRGFGLHLPESCEGLSRAARHQVETVFREYLRSLDTCLEWVDEILMQGAPSAVVEMIEGLRGDLEALAMARMDLHSIYDDNVDRSCFDARADEVKRAVLPRLKALLDGHVRAGAQIMRNPYRLVEASNDQLSMEVLNARGQDRFKVQDSFPLPYRMLLNEIGALRREMEQLRSLRQRHVTEG